MRWWGGDDSVDAGGGDGGGGGGTGGGGKDYAIFQQLHDKNGWNFLESSGFVAKIRNYQTKTLPAYRVVERW